MRHLYRLEDGIARVEGFALCALVLGMVLLSSLQIVMRLAFHSGIMWADPMLRYMVLWAGFIGAALAARHGRHFCLDLAHKFLHGGLGRAARAGSSLVSAAVCVLLIDAAWKFLREEKANAVVSFSMGSFDVMAAWTEFILPLGFALILFHTVIGVFRPEEA